MLQAPLAKFWTSRVSRGDSDLTEFKTLTALAALSRPAHRRNDGDKMDATLGAGTFQSAVESLFETRFEKDQREDATMAFDTQSAGGTRPHTPPQSRPLRQKDPASSAPLGIRQHSRKRERERERGQRERPDVSQSAQTSGGRKIPSFLVSKRKEREQSLHVFDVVSWFALN